MARRRTITPDARSKGQRASSPPAPGPRVLLGTITASHVHISTALAVREAERAGVIVDWLPQLCGPYLDMGRNNVVSRAMSLDTWDWLLFVDSDITFTPRDITTLLRPVWRTPTTTPVIGGVYLNPTHDGVHPVVYGWDEDKPLEGTDATSPGFWQLDYSALESTPPFYARKHRDVCEVTALGTGFLAISRAHLTLMAQVFPPPNQWFWEGVLHERLTGEDFGFCARTRALNYPVLCHRGVRLGHYKTVCWIPKPTS